MALLFTILCGTAAISLGYFINYFAKGHFIHSTEAVLDAELRYIESVDMQHLDASPPMTLYVLLNEDGSLPEDIPPPSSLLSEGIILFDHHDGNRYAAKIHTFEDGRKLLVGTDITVTSQDFKFMQQLGIASIVFVVLVVFIAFVISIFVVSGTNKIAETAKHIMETGDLSQRVKISARWDDLSNMAAVLNMLLDRVEDLMQGVKQVSDNVAHDLRTPLTRMRNKIEGLEKEYGHDDYTDLMSEADQLLNTFNALLRISRIETEKQRSQFTDVDLKEVLEDVIDLYEPLAEDKEIKLNIELENAHIHADRDLIFQAYANLLDNAVKFTPQDGHVSLNLSQKDGTTRVEITDTGTGIKNNEKEKIFTRFYRGEKSRTSKGTGLGLSLVSAVIELHAGRIEVENTNPGLKVITTF